MAFFPRRTKPAVMMLFVLSQWITLSASAQSVTRVGSDETFDVATWNIEWFGATGSGQGPSDITLQRANVRRTILEAGIDLWAVQEISDTQQFQLLLNELEAPWTGLLATESGQQRVGFVYNTDVIRFRAVKHILESFATGPLPPAGTNFFASRPPLQLDVDVLLPDTTVRLMFITLHMKCCSDISSYERRIEAAKRLKTHIDFNYGVLGDPIAAVLGDFNDELSGSIYPGNPTPYTTFLDDPSAYSFLTWPLDQQNVPTFCSNTLCSFGSTLDHILITSKVFSHYVDASATRLESVLTAIPNYTNSTSDHMPVYAVFSFPTSTGIAHLGEAPNAFGLVEVFPNPVRENLTVSFEADHAGLVDLSIFDMLGRRVHASSSYAGAARNQITVPASELANGLYLLRIASGTDSTDRTFVKWN